MISIDTRAIGLAVVALGGGRVRAADPVDPAVGLNELALVGDALDVGDPIAIIHARSEDAADAAEATVRAAYAFGGARAVSDDPVILETITAQDV